MALFCFWYHELMVPRRIVLWICLIVITMSGLEALSYIGLATLLGTFAVPSKTTAMQRAVWSSSLASSALFSDALFTSVDNSPHAADGNVLHPYLGFVRVPKDAHVVGNLQDSLSAYGFAENSGTLVRSASGDTVVVGIFGGSVAYFFLTDPIVQQKLSDAIVRFPQFAGKKVIFSGVALGGFKQPQMLLAYTYLLSLGAHFDVVIELDGFNDITLGMIENFPKHVSVLYPRGWYFLANQENPDLIADRRHLFALQDHRVLLATLAHQKPLKWSFTVRALWLFVDTCLSHAFVRVEQKMVQQIDAPTSFGVTGPVERQTEEASSLRLLAEMWRKSSLQMERISHANGALYFHFLQPNQYLQGSKPYGVERREGLH